MDRPLHLAGYALVLAGCAAPSPPRPALTAADLGAWESAHVDAVPADARPLRAASLALPSGGSAPVATGPLTLHTREAAPPRPARRAHVDVSFRDADMINAFQFLADSGSFNLVMQDGLSGHVSATLHRVDPYDALVTLAEANGARVSYDHKIVVVRKRP